MPDDDPVIATRDGLLLKPAEADVLDYIRAPQVYDAGRDMVAINGRNAYAVIGALEALGRLRAERLAGIVGGNPHPDQLADTILRAAHRATERVIVEDERLTPAHTHVLKDLVASYAALANGLSGRVDGAEYAAQARELQATKGELAEAIKRRHALEVAIDRTLAAADASAGAYFEPGGALDQLGTELDDLGRVRHGAEAPR